MRDEQKSLAVQTLRNSTVEVRPASEYSRGAHSARSDSRSRRPSETAPELQSRGSQDTSGAQGSGAARRSGLSIMYIGQIGCSDESFSAVAVSQLAARAVPR